MQRQQINNSYRLGNMRNDNSQFRSLTSIKEQYEQNPQIRPINTLSGTSIDRNYVNNQIINRGTIRDSNFKETASKIIQSNKQSIITHNQNFMPINKTVYQKGQKRVNIHQQIRYGPEKKMEIIEQISRPKYTKRTRENSQQEHQQQWRRYPQQQKAVCCTPLCWGILGCLGLIIFLLALLCALGVICNHNSGQIISKIEKTGPGKPQIVQPIRPGFQIPTNDQQLNVNINQNINNAVAPAIPSINPVENTQTNNLQAANQKHYNNQNKKTLHQLS